MSTNFKHQILSRSHVIQRLFSLSLSNSSGMKYDVFKNNFTSHKVYLTLMATATLRISLSARLKMTYLWRNFSHFIRAKDKLIPGSTLTLHPETGHNISSVELSFNSVAALHQVMPGQMTWWKSKWPGRWPGREKFGQNSIKDQF